jgi:hypothetical protein
MEVKHELRQVDETTGRAFPEPDWNSRASSPLVWAQRTVRTGIAGLRSGKSAERILHWAAQSTR